MAGDLRLARGRKFAKFLYKTFLIWYRRESLSWPSKDLLKPWRERQTAVLKRC